MQSDKVRIVKPPFALDGLIGSQTVVLLGREEQVLFVDSKTPNLKTLKEQAHNIWRIAKGYAFARDAEGQPTRTEKLIAQLEAMNPTGAALESLKAAKENWEAVLAAQAEQDWHDAGKKVVWALYHAESGIQKMTAHLRNIAESRQEEDACKEAAEALYAMLDEKRHTMDTPLVSNLEEANSLMGKGKYQLALTNLQWLQQTYETNIARQTKRQDRRGKKPRHNNGRNGRASEAPYGVSTNHAEDLILAHAD